MLARLAWLGLLLIPSLSWAQSFPLITVVPTVGASTVSWAVSITPRVSGFVSNSSVAVELDLEFAGTINSFTLNNAFWNVNGSNTGNNPFTGTNTETVLDQTPANDTLFIAAGSELFTTATPQLLATIVTQGTGGALVWGGRTAAGHQTARIAQAGINYDGISGGCVCDPGSISGDFDGNGAVGNGDLTLLLDYWGDTVPPTLTGWIGTAPTAPAVGNDELTWLLDAWGDISGSAAAIVPEPASLLLAMMGACVLGIRRRS